MDAYKVVLAGSVGHDVRRIGKRNLGRIMEAVESLSRNPFPRGCRKLKALKKASNLAGDLINRVVTSGTEDAKLQLVK